ncbi:MAG: hypothetical protein R2708_07390 [Vicinamibacterales bacterium]
MKTERVAIVAALVACLSACSNGTSAALEPPNIVDATGLVEFHLPAGWEPLASSEKSRFTPGGAEGQSAMLAVVPEARDSNVDIETYWTRIKSVHLAQDRDLRHEARFTLDGFEVREGIFDTERNGQPAVYHDLYLFSETLQVNVHLNGTREFHERRVDDLQTVARSVRALGAAP